MPVIRWHIFWIWSLEGNDLIYESKQNIDKNADFMLQSLDARICQEWRVV